MRPLLEGTHYYPYGLTMAAISSNALKGANYSKNRKEFNGIEHTTDLDLNQYDAFYRSLDPQVGRWFQVDPKPNEMFSPYAAMANNPILYSDPGGDTNWVFGTAGQYLGTINDRLANQVHFMNNDDAKTKPFDASNLTNKEAKKLAQAMRGASVASMGEKTAADMQAISNQSDKLNKELGFVGSIGNDKEIRLTAMKVDENNSTASVNLLSQLDKNYSKEQQAGLFLFGHVHYKGLMNGFLYGDGSPMTMQKFLGDPTDPNDYQPGLYRSGNASEKGRSPALIPTSYGVTIYGTGTSSSRTGYGNVLTIENQVNPSNNSFLLYKSLKR
nr:RHS repeat-associated core domain-containing protein [Chitinophaga hostae]